MGEKFGFWHKEIGIRLRVFENRVLRRIFGLKRDEIIGDWRKLHYEDFNNVCTPVIGMIQSNRMRQAEHVARVCVCV
jgi:hypothetical protein